MFHPSSKAIQCTKIRKNRLLIELRCNYLVWQFVCRSQCPSLVVRWAITKNYEQQILAPLGHHLGMVLNLPIYSTREDRDVDSLKQDDGDGSKEREKGFNGTASKVLWTLTESAVRQTRSDSAPNGHYCLSTSTSSRMNTRKKDVKERGRKKVTCCYRYCQTVLLNLVGAYRNSAEMPGHKLHLQIKQSKEIAWDKLPLLL